MRRFFSLLTLAIGLASFSTSCTMPESESTRSSKTSYPKIVETQQGASMLGGEEGNSGWDNAIRGIKSGD
ncbi:MAG: hypothetical protein O3A95_10715 [Planctomycetota bacterium]|nr:hypothetical protein [Planctomycetota bacterium]MDA1114754.1 hypothetical protein [Planctomycetota bacterium]